MQEIYIDKICKSFWSKSRGLMFSPKKTLVFIFKRPQRISLHNFFVFYPINLLFLDENHKVIEKKRFYPFTFYKSKKKSKYLIESPKQDAKLYEFITIKLKR